MGGLGSGNRYNHSGGATCEAMRRVDLRYLRKQGMLVPGASGSLSWSMGGEPIGSIGYRARSDGLQLIYRATDHDGEWRSIDETVWFDSTAQHLGGSRQWFRCPRCKRRCLVLYGGTWFRCRKCYRLTYQSQREDSLQRSFSQARKTRHKLGGSGSLDEPFPDKPKGMHWRSYRRFVRRAETLEDRIEVLEQALFQSFLSRL